MMKPEIRSQLQDARLLLGLQAVSLAGAQSALQDRQLAELLGEIRETELRALRAITAVLEETE